MKKISVSLTQEELKWLLWTIENGTPDELFTVDYEELDEDNKKHFDIHESFRNELMTAYYKLKRSK